MAQYIDKDALVEEIKHHLQFIPEHTNAFIEGEEHAYNKILSFINTLEVKEVDLQTELGKYIEHYRNKETGYTMLGIAKHFFELGMAASIKAQKGE